MASSIFSLYFVVIFLQLYSMILVPVAGGSGELIYEDGYTVSTVINGDKLNFKVNPQSILHQSPPSDLFIVLDSVASTFYTASLPTTSNETVFKSLAGNGVSGYVDGDLASAKFDKPKNFAIDLTGNIYVADNHNHAIRKISKSGVTTIAGGSSQKPGHTDGPARDASFSDDFELTFISERCALMICDHGNRLVREIRLKAEDCSRNSGSVLGTTPAWLLGMGLCSLISLAIGLLIRPYVIPYVSPPFIQAKCIDTNKAPFFLLSSLKHQCLTVLYRQEGARTRQSPWTWTRCQTSLERRAAMLCSDLRSAVVKSRAYSLSHQIILLTLSHLSLVFRRTPPQPRPRQKPVSLMDMDFVCNSNSSSNSSSSSCAVISPLVAEQLKDLLTFDKGLANTYEMVEREEERESSDVSCYEQKRIDGMMQVNLTNFEGEAATRVGSSVLSVVRRR